jgi:cell division protein ZapA
LAQVTVSISGKTFRMACDDGQEEHLRGLARSLDATIEDMRAGFGEIGDLRLTVMSAISVLDQLGEASRRIARLEAELAVARSNGVEADGAREEREAAAVRRIAEMTGRVTALAEALSGSKTRD